MDFLGFNIDKFSEKHGLTGRESEVFQSLISSSGNLKIVSKELKISINTINNHLKSIFRKTSTHSKSELVSQFLIFSTSSLKQVPNSFKKLRVMIVDDEEDLCGVLASELKKFGFETAFCSESENAMKEIEEFYPDVILCDIRMPGIDGMELLKKVRKKSSTYPIMFFMSAYSDYEIENLLNQGGVDLIQKPLSIANVYQTILDHVFSPKNILPKGENRFARDKAIFFEKVNIGLGGVFAPFEENENLNSKVSIGSHIDFNFPLSGKEENLYCRGTVVWKREEDHGELPAGVGIRFKYISKDDEDFIRIQSQKENILSFVPIS